MISTTGNVKSVAVGSTVGSLIVAALLVAIGFITLYDSMSYSDVDSKVFPRAAAILLIITSMISIVMTLLKPIADEGFGTGIWWRRILLVCSMLAACIIMPKFGFIAASAVAFVGALIAAMHEKWRAVNVVIYGLSGAVVVGGFYALFKFVLSVPLP
ncbi:MAG: tripartite tricarboxylate transporter TctB family protein [Granulosicoccus sp.]